MPLTVTHAKSDTIADFTGTITGFNSAGATTTVAATNLVRPSDWNSAHQVTLALSASEIASLFNFGTGLTSTTAAGGISVGFDNEMRYAPFILPNAASTLSSPGIGTWYLDPFNVPQGLDSGRIHVFVSNAAGFLNGAAYSAASSGSITREQTLYNRLAIYAYGSGASTTRLERIWSADCSHMFTWVRRVSGSTTSNLTVTNSLVASFPGSFDESGGVTYSTTSQSGTTSVGASTGNSTLANNLITGVVAYVSGARVDVIPFATKLGPGAYWMANCFTSTDSSTGTRYSTGTMMSTQSRLGMADFALEVYKSLGATVSNSSTQARIFDGFLATTTSAASSIIATSDIRVAANRMYWNQRRY